jgi:pimeloyl-ACP methyl ester carboxylesterase
MGTGRRIEVPTAHAVFPRELSHPPRSWAERVYNIVRWTPMQAGGHFAALEEPEALAQDLREFFRPLREAYQTGGKGAEGGARC